MEDKDRFKLLLESLVLVASSFEDQRKSIPDFAVLADEISSTYGDAYLLVGQLLKAGLVGKTAVKILKELDDHFGSALTYDESEEIGSDEAVRSHPFWERAREIAREALGTINQK